MGPPGAALGHKAELSFGAARCEVSMSADSCSLTFFPDVVDQFDEVESAEFAAPGWRNAFDTSMITVISDLTVYDGVASFVVVYDYVWCRECFFRKSSGSNAKIELRLCRCLSRREPCSRIILGSIRLKDEHTKARKYQNTPSY